MRIRFSILVPLFNTPENYLREMIQSVIGQKYKDWELCLADASDAEHRTVGEIVKEYASADPRIKYKKLQNNGGISENTNACIDMSSGNYFALLDHDDVLDLEALQKAAHVISQTGADFVYTDEAKFTSDPEDWFSPNYKPDFSKYELRAHNYICHLTIYSRELLQKAGRYRKECDGSQDHDMVLRLTENARHIVHIPRILYYWRVHENSVSSGVAHKEYAINAAKKAVLDQVHRSGREAKILSHSPFPLIYDVRYSMPDHVSVDVIIYGTDNVTNLKDCVTSLQNSSREFPLDFKVIAPFDKVKEFDAIEDEIIEENSYKVVKSADNISKAINLIIKHSSADFILIINGNSVVQSEHFIEELVNLAQLEDVAAVGPKLTTDSGIVFSAGIALCGAIPNGIVHRFQGEIAESYGYEAGLCHVREATAVSGNCFMVSREKIKELGGMSEKYNSYMAVDYCIRAAKNDFKVLWTPYAEVTVHKSIDFHIRESEIRQFRSEYKKQLSRDDRYYNKSIRYDVDHITDRNTPSVLIRKSVDTVMESGVNGLKEKISIYRGGAGRRSSSHLNFVKETSHRMRYFKDVLFINGCAPQLPHPTRYRVIHQQEQLNACGISSDIVYYEDVNADLVRFYRLFIIFRCPYTEEVGKLIARARAMNRTVLYDIDDLVIDTKYTDTIPYVQKMKDDDRKLYDDGVIRMGKTLQLCDGAITTTEALAEELRHYVPEVFINRNVASDAMYQYSEQANYKRDILPMVSKDRIPVWLNKKEYEKALKAASDRRPDHVRIGYFSGSITHNSDFEMILPAISRILKENPNVELHVVGLLDLPESLKPLKDQVVSEPFTDWEKLPDQIASVDINIAPITESIFNAAKSENKWTEASLVKVPTVASDFGAFKTVIQNKETGLLCKTVEDWYQSLNLLIHDPSERKRIGNNAYRYVKEHYITIYTGDRLADYIRSKMTPNIAFALPSLNISGGIYVTLKHAAILKKSGRDVFIINMDYRNGYFKFEDEEFPVLSRVNTILSGKVDCAVATFWETLSFFESYREIQNLKYLVQGYETDFYRPGNPNRIWAEASYHPLQPVEFITISKWCEKWLNDRYHHTVQYIPNGINSEQFYPKKRTMQGKIRILIEGDCESYYKNVDESFRIVNQLDRKKIEVWYLSYNGKGKNWYHPDKNFNRIPHEKVDEIYRQCDILLKSSILESFSYPPLEMMATGGFVVAVQNDGNSEYLMDEWNCLIYSRGDVDMAVKQIKRLATDNNLRQILYEGGQKTAKERNWINIESDILKTY